ncbi:unnamed protein product [Prorocentrum cordatum]|uniref:Uncharacterized protein n=1 Tax=Prorocentrum cordatum TaxID=2364126 RepID=A0ABN9T3G1_9DINO|nr:unnamed protein product [Polarella glacialis]
MMNGVASEAAAAPPARGAAFLLAVRQAADAAEAHRLFLQASSGRAAPWATAAEPAVGAAPAARGGGSDCEGFSRARVAAVAAAASYQRLLRSGPRADISGVALALIGALDGDWGGAAGRRGRGAAGAAAAAAAPAPRALFAAGARGLEPPLPTDGGQRPAPAPPGLEHSAAAGWPPRPHQPEAPARGPSEWRRS